MKKRILAMVLAFAMVFTFVSVFAADPATVKEAIVQYGANKNLTGDALTRWLTRSIEVPLDIQVKKAADDSWAETVEVDGKDISAIPSFDLMATLDMSVVKEAFDDLVGSAGVAINTVGGANAATLIDALEDISVAGTFTITINLPENITFPENYTADNKDMNGFDDGAKEIFTETERAIDGNTVTIKIAVDKTKKDLEAKIGRPITFTVEGVKATAFGTYKFEGKLDGSTVIGGDIATINYSTTPLGTVDETDHNPDGATAPWASATIKATRISSGGGGGVKTPATKEEYEIKFIVDGEVVATENTSSGKINVGTITPAEKEGYEFAGWYYDAQLTKPATGQITLKDNTTLYAKYVVAGIGDTPVLNADDHGAYIIGYTDGTVRPLNNIVREEVATIFFRLLTEAAGEAMHKDVAPYSDVPATKWSSTAIATLSNGGYITGRPDGTFGPNDYITRAEFATIAARFMKNAEGNGIEFSDVQKHWAKNYIEACAASGIITGYQDGTFKPDQFITRAEAMAIVNRMLGREVTAEGIEAVKDDIYYFADNAENTWCYYIVLEATNAHDYTKAEDGTETWTKVTEVRDWAKYEK